MRNSTGSTKVQYFTGGRMRFDYREVRYTSPATSRILGKRKLEDMAHM